MYTRMVATILHAEFHAHIQTSHTTGIGGVFVARARDNRLNSLQDIRGKVVVAELAGFSFLEGCLLQWREMMRHGMFLTEDPAAVIWNSGGQVVSVKLVEQGLADVAFLRTSMLELLEYQRVINMSDFKILGSRTALWRGEPFPSVTSTGTEPIHTYIHTCIHAYRGLSRMGSPACP